MTLEYIVVDGMSNDGTEKTIEENASKISISIREPDQGIYDALNKGIRAASGEIVGFLHADDIFADRHAIGRIHAKFQEADYDAVYGDLLYVDAENTGKIIRYWKSGDFRASRFRFGWMPPHPTVYIKKAIYEKYGLYRTDLGSAADYECLIRMMVKHQLRVGYVPEIIVKMRVGGASNASLLSRLIANRADLQAWIENGLQTSPWFEIYQTNLEAFTVLQATRAKTALSCLLCLAIFETFAQVSFARSGFAKVAWQWKQA